MLGIELFQKGLLLVLAREDTVTTATLLRTNETKSVREFYSRRVQVAILVRTGGLKCLLHRERFGSLRPHLRRRR
jgi:hypothetical protein